MSNLIKHTLRKRKCFELLLRPALARRTKMAIKAKHMAKPNKKQQPYHYFH